MFPQGQHTEAVIQRGPRLGLMLVAKPSKMCKSFPGGAGFEGTKTSWRQLRLAFSEELNLVPSISVR